MVDLILLVLLGAGACGWLAYLDERAHRIRISRMVRDGEEYLQEYTTELARRSFKLPDPIEETTDEIPCSSVRGRTTTSGDR